VEPAAPTALQQLGHLPMLSAALICVAKHAATRLADA
jgi:hypothetical protein